MKCRKKNENNANEQNSLNGRINGEPKRTEQKFWNPIIYDGGNKKINGGFGCFTLTGPWRRHLHCFGARWNLSHKCLVIKSVKNYGTLCRTLVATWNVVDLGSFERFVSWSIRKIGRCPRSSIVKNLESRQMNNTLIRIRIDPTGSSYLHVRIRTKVRSSHQSEDFGEFIQKRKYITIAYTLYNIDHPDPAYSLWTEKPH